MEDPPAVSTEDAQTVREQALSALLRGGQLVEAGLLLSSWQQVATVQGDRAQLAWIFEQLANLELGRGMAAAALQCLQRSLSLWQECERIDAVCRLSWSIGAFLASQGCFAAAMPPLRRAVVLAEVQGLPQVVRYRARLDEVAAALERLG